MSKARIRVVEAVNEIAQKAIPKPVRWLAMMGNASGTVLTGTSGWVYVTTLNGDTWEVLNRRVPNKAGRKVWVGYDSDAPGVLQVLSLIDVYGSQDSSPLVPDHAETHDYGGGDTVFISAPQVKPFLVLPAGGFEVQILGGVFQKEDGTFGLVDNQVVDLSSYQPATGALYVLLEYDDDGVVSATVGSTLDTRDLLQLSDIPTVTENPLCAIQLYGGQTQIQRNPAGTNDFVDLRFGWPRTANAGNATFLDGIAVDMFVGPSGDGPTDGQVMVYDAYYDAWVPSDAGAGDMLKSVYDTNDDGVVDEAEDTQAVDGILVDNSTPPTDGQVWIYDAYLSKMVPDDIPVSGSAGLVLISDQLLASPAASVTFSSIPGTYKALILDYVARSSQAGAGGDSFYQQCNSDSGTNYDYLYIYDTGGGAGRAYLTAAGSATPYISGLPKAGDTAGYVSQGRIIIPNYAGTTFYKGYQMRTSVQYSAATAGMFLIDGHGTWKNTAAITRLDYIPTSGANFITGSRFTLYGLQ